MTTKKEARARRAAKAGQDTGLGNFDANQWALVRTAIRAGLSRTIGDLSHGTIREDDLVKLSGFCMSALMLLDKVHPAQWAAAKLDADQMDRIAQEWERINAAAAAEAETERRAEADRQAAADEAAEIAGSARRQRTPRHKSRRDYDNG